VYPLRYIEDFFPSRKLEERLKIRFRSREGFCRPSLDKIIVRFAACLNIKPAAEGCFQ